MSESCIEKEEKEPKFTFVIKTSCSHSEQNTLNLIIIR